MLVQHAETELRRAGLFDADSDYDGAIGPAVLELVSKFAEQGHSGFSARLVLLAFDKVARFMPLTGITSSPDEWMQISNDRPGGPATWQSRRQSTCFSLDGGKTYYDIDEKRSWARRKLGLGYRGFTIHQSATA